MIEVTYFFRKPFPNQFSIEELFRTVRNHLPPGIQPAVHVAEHHSKGFLPRVRIALAAFRNRGRINHITGDIHYIAPMLPRKRTILTIHDCVTLSRRSGFLHWLLKTVWFTIPVRSVAIVTVISEKTRVELKSIVNIDDSRIKVIPNCVAPEVSQGPCSTLDPGNVRILQIGVKQNKNLARLAQALDGLPCTLEIIGVPDEQQVEILNAHGIDYHAREKLSREELVASYRQADIVAFVSTYEGFGMPVIEAQACGTALLTSDLSPMKEVAGPGACLVDPADVAGIRSGLLRLIGDTEYRSGVIRAGLENVKRFQPETVAAQYAEIYRQLASE